MSDTSSIETFTREDAVKQLQQYKGNAIVHCVELLTGRYAFMSHISCEFCDYCGDDNLLSAKDVPTYERFHPFKDDPYENQRALFGEDFHIPAPTEKRKQELRRQLGLPGESV